jgi:cytochrome d ubiquinol oxidase subunit II
MLGTYITGFDHSLAGIAFSCLIAVVLCSAYCLIGACWLIMKTEGTLQEKSVKWAKYHLVNSVAGLVSISAVTPLMSPRIFEKWFSLPEAFFLAPIPILTGGLIIGLYLLLRKMPLAQDRYCWLPFVMTVFIYVLSFIGLAYSFFPFIVPNQMTIVDAAAAPASLFIMLFGALIVIPILIGYTALAYYIFRGKATELSYD